MFRAHGIMLTVAFAVALATTGQAAADALTVTVSPAEAYLRPGAEVRFTASVTDAQGRPVSAELSWSVIPPRLGRVGADGRLVALNNEGRGIVRVVARHGEATGSGHAVIEVGSAAPRRLSVTVAPPDAATPTGGQVQFEASVTDPLTGESVSADVRWVVLPDALGVVTGSGLFTAGDASGAGRVAAHASSGGREGVGAASVVVGEPESGRLRVIVRPPRALLRPGDEARFEAIVLDESGQSVQVPVEWSVVPRALGAITAGGVFTAGPEEMDGRVVATAMAVDGPARGFAAVEVRYPGPAGLRVHIRPKGASVAPGGDVQFEAVVLGPDNEPIDVPVDWHVRPEWLGTVSADGFFTAAEEFPEPASGGGWRGAVTASVTTTEGTASDAARVFVRAMGPTARLRITPARAVVAPGQEVQFDAEVVGPGGPIPVTVEWAVLPPGLGTITPDGLFTANPAYGDPTSPEFGPHEGAVGARATLPDGTTLSDLAHVLVRVPGVPVRVIVEPRVALVPPGESTQFHAVVLGPDGEELEVPVTWGVVPQRIGTITPDGLFTAATDFPQPGSPEPPTGRVTAQVVLGQDRVFIGAAVVIINIGMPEVVVRVRPREATLRPGQTRQFEALVLDQNGSPLPLPVEWQVLNAEAGSISPDGLFTATTQILPGQVKQTRVVATVTQGGEVYSDAALVRVVRPIGGGGSE
ncbi:MAG: hypothetical protein FJY74_04700 [Candidatus Eisenbacteria bacterium]|nr:hypothetical protein [Candidatus Eisenbacteria bacterium]